VAPTMEIAPVQLLEDLPSTELNLLLSLEKSTNATRQGRVVFPLLVGGS
jgi:hypothetical protein